MIDSDDDVYLLRDRREADDVAAVRSAPPAASGQARKLAVTKTVATYPTAAAAFYACSSQAVTGTETEGGAATITTLSDTFYAWNRGSAIPPTGTKVEVTFVDYRWTLRYDG